MDEDVADDDLQMAVVLGARANLSVRRALLSVREGRVRKRVGGSRPGRRPNRPRDFDLGAYAILREPGCLQRQERFGRVAVNAGC